MSNTNQPDVLIIVKSKKDYITAIFSIVWIGFFMATAKSNFHSIFPLDNKSSIFYLLFLLAAIYLLLHLIWFLFGKTAFIVSNNKLIVKTGVLFFNIKHTYEVNLIKNPGIEYDVPSKSTWGRGFLSIPIYTSTVLTFSYNSKKIMLGLNLEKFDVEQLRNAIKTNH